MTKKKDEQEEKIEDEIKAEVTDQVDAEKEALINQLKEAEEKIVEYKDGWARSQAEFQNYKKRIERDNDLMRSSMKGDIVKKILPVLDDLERALQNRSADDAWADGIELIARKMQTILENDGVIRIEAKGAAFDPNFHEAISHEPSDDVESGYVIDVVQNGYVIGERVIRPALVRVAQ
ncbi:MAG: protein GrpE [Chloroflexi bacterium OLB14]|nr:MAG: protein GrpE [Chloroflexi bacterium OLB14]